MSEAWQLALVCVAAVVAAQAIWAQETKEKVTVDDVDRNFMVRLPKGYDAKQHYPVVIVLHGMNQDAEDMERLTRFDELADKEGMIAVYPIALHGRWNVGVRPTSSGRWAWDREGDTTAEEAVIRAEAEVEVVILEVVAAEEVSARRGTAAAPGPAAGGSTGAARR